MKGLDLYTSSQILGMEDLYELQDTFSSCGIAFKYELTEGELGWAKFIKGKYSIADWVLENTEKGVLTFNCPFALSEAIHNDGMEHKGVMLSDDTALQKLFFWLSD